jgi:hypothetical protein
VSARRLQAVAAVAGPDAPDVSTRLDGYVSDVLALPHAEQLADLSVYQMAVELGRHLERADLGIALRPRPSRPRRLSLAVGPEPGDRHA